MSVMMVLSLLGGLGLFLFGMKVMGEALEKAAGTKLKRLLELVTSNRLLAVLVGILVTAVIQSSSATTVMVVGFVNAGLLTLTQAVGVIMGANIGTTVTSLMLSVELDFGAIFACVGMLLMFIPKRETIKQLGAVMMGLGVLFVGMNTMTDAMAPLKDWEGFRSMMASVSSPLVGVLVGAGITAILQSSSASVGILQALAGQGLIPLSGAIFILFGQNIGTCVTALLSSAGTNHVARRAAMVHLLFNVIGTIVFVALALLLPVAQWIEALAPDNTRLQIAFCHVFFNVGTTLLLLPMARLLEKAACLMVPGTDAPKEPMALLYFDERLLPTPAIAAAQLFREVRRMGDIVTNNYSRAVNCFMQWDETAVEEITENEQIIDYLNEEITRCLVEVKGLDLNEADTRMLGSLFHVVNDMERIGDHSMNIAEYAQSKYKDEIKFSTKAQQELADLSQQVSAMVNQAMNIFQKQLDDKDIVASVEAQEDQVDNTTEALREHHLERLKNKKCSARNSLLYMDMLTNLERVGDHAVNIATSVDKPPVVHHNGL